MQNKIVKKTILLSEEEIDIINQYPGTTFSGRLHSLLSEQKIRTSDPEADLKKEYERLLKGYMREYYPELQREIADMREEAKRLLEASNAIKNTLEVVEHFDTEMRAIINEAEEIAMENLRKFVTVRRKPEERR